MRLFTCIYPSDSALDHLDMALQGLPLPISDAKQGGRRGGSARGTRYHRGGHSAHDQQLRWVPPDLRHITLVFHGEVPEGAVPDYLDGLTEAARELEPFEARLSGSGAFSGRTLWTGVSDGLAEIRKLSALAETAAADAGIRSDNRAGGRPHLSLARASSRHTAAPLDDWVHALVLYRGPLFPVNTIHVVQSELGKGRHGGPQYSDVATIPLTPDPYSHPRD